MLIIIRNCLLKSCRETRHPILKSVWGNNKFSVNFILWVVFAASLHDVFLYDFLQIRQTWCSSCVVSGERKKNTILLYRFHTILPLVKNCCLMLINPVFVEENKMFALWIPYLMPDQKNIAEFPQHTSFLINSGFYAHFYSSGPLFGRVSPCQTQLPYSHFF